MSNKFKILNFFFGTKTFQFKIARGFTLIEMLLYMALMSIFLIVLTDILVSIIGAKVSSQTFTSVEQDGRYILARLNYDISRANSITTPGAIGTSTNNLILIIGPDTYTYSLAGENLQLQVNATPADNLNGSNSTLSAPIFKKLANSAIAGTKETVQVQFVLTSKATTASGPETKTYQTTVGRRQ